MKDRSQPAETLGKVVKYKCNGKWHHPFFANYLNWSLKNTVPSGVISKHGIITEYEVIKCSNNFLNKLKADLKFMLNSQAANLIK